MDQVRPSSDDSGFEELDFLLPNGFMVTMACDRQSSLLDVKTLLWEKAVQLPSAHLLRNSEHYVFVGVSNTAVEEEYDDTQTIGDLCLVKNMLEVARPRVAREMIKVNHNVGEAISIAVQTLDSESVKTPEFKQVRAWLRQICHRLALERETWSIERQARFFYPPNFDRNEDLPTCTARKIMQNPEYKITINVWFYDIEGKVTHAVKVPAPDCPVRVIEAALIARETAKGYAVDDVAEKVRTASATFVLKLCDKEEYLLQECCIHTYEYIRNCINKNQIPQLQIVKRENVLNSIPDNSCVILQQEIPSDEVFHRPTSDLQIENAQTTWDLSHDVMYSIKVRNYPVRRDDPRIQNMFVQAQLFHGNQPLSKTINTSDKGFNVTWEFDVSVNCLPRYARLCFITFVQEKDSVTSRYLEPRAINWVNVQVFDHNCKLTTGRQIFRVTNFPSDTNLKSYPLGAAGSSLSIGGHDLEFEVIAPAEGDIYYKSSSDLDRLIEREATFDSGRKSELKSFELLDRIVNKDPLDHMSKSEMEFLWEHRQLAKEYQPNLLPRLVQCVDWKERHHVFELYSLLQGWSEDLSIATALQLIGPSYPDNRVRSIAVKTLDTKLTNELLDLFMLQLVQAVKLECYHQNDLSRLLLTRALHHKNIGHRFFWHLRSEMHMGLSRLKFAPLLEAYCLYCGSAVFDGLLSEVKALNECKQFTASSKGKSLEEQSNSLRAWLEKDSTKEVIADQSSVMNQNVMLGEMSIDDCKVMSSKQRPLWLTWKNRSPLGEDVGAGTIKYIIKHGDDLRQDMLVLQLIKLMDMKWKYSCRDYWIIPYDCMYMDEMFGIIEVIGEAKTVCDIEMHKQTGVLATTGMHEWLYKTSGGGTQYLDAVKRFKHSCAAFCVITFVLGIGDRHSDNIMIKTAGQLFHIDFGHFMNHKKDKLGISRERTPFVLTKDFVRVITQGDVKKVIDNEDFKSFLCLCLEAFLTVRRNGTLFLTLLSLMMHCELPELTEIADINYCRKCFALDKPEHEAANNFYKAILSSYAGQWMTKFDWFMHRVNRSLQGTSSSDS